MEFNKQNLKSFRTEMEDALGKVGKKYGVTFNIGNIRFTSDTFSTTVKCYGTATKSDTGKLEWDKSCFMFGFEKTDFNKMFTMTGKKYQIVGIRPRSFKYPIVGKEIGGTKSFKFNAEGVKKNLI
jgi:hypothetical protein